MPRHKTCPTCQLPVPPAPPLREDSPSLEAYRHEWDYWKRQQLATRGRCECARCTTCWDVYEDGRCHCARQKESA